MTTRVSAVFSIASRCLVLALLCAIAVLITAQPASAAGSGPYDGNYCAACHLADDPLVAQVTAWSGGSGQPQSLCGPANQVRDELYYTERLLQATEKLRGQVAGSPQALTVASRMVAQREGYSRLLEAPVVSRDAFVAEAQNLRYQIQKNYTLLNQARATQQRQRVALTAGIVTLLLAALLGWGLRQTHRFAPGKVLGLRFGFPSLLFLALLFLFFSLPIFQAPIPPTDELDAAALARQSAIDVANRTAITADHIQARIASLASAAAAQQAVDAGEAKQTLGGAISAEKERQLGLLSLWGQAQGAREKAIAAPADVQKAALASGRLEAATVSNWGLRSAALSWLPHDANIARQLLRQAQESLPAPDVTSQDADLERYNVAIAWLQVDPQRATPVIGMISDAALRATALRKSIPQGDRTRQQRALQAAREISDPARRGAALADLGAWTGDQGLFGEALTAWKDAPDDAAAFGLARLVATAADPSIIALIKSSDLAVMALAQLNAGRPAEAWASALQISDFAERARAQEEIASRWQNGEAAQSIAEPSLRARALRRIAVAKGEVALAQSIGTAFERTLALAELGQVDAARESARELLDSYPLRAVATAIADAGDSAAANSLLALLQPNTRDVDKAVVLTSLARIDASLAPRALEAALAARVRGEPTAPVQASLALAHALKPNSAQGGAALAQAIALAAGVK